MIIPVAGGGADGKRPNTLYFVTSEGGKGLELCGLVINALPENYALSPKEIAESFEPNALRDFVPLNGQFIKGEKTTIEDQPAGWVHYSLETDRAGIKLRSLYISYVIYYDKKLINFSCGVGDGADKSKWEIEKQYSLYFPLFQQMANSIVIHSKWKHF